MASQRFNNETVLDAAHRRIGFVFDHYENIIVSVSGGKDSTVLAHLALAEAQRRDRRIGVYFLDEEVVYQSSVEQVAVLMAMFLAHTKRMWLQVPFNLTNATSLTDGQLRAWEPGEHKMWMRAKRDDAMKAKPWVQEQETIRDKPKGFGFYDAIEAFARCHHSTAFLVGLRAAGESPNRWRAVTKNPITVDGKPVYWGTAKEQGNVTLYPIYDWNVHDVWKYIHDERLPYSKIYDMMLKKGYHPSTMRISSLVHERAFRSIVDLPEFEPKTYAKLQKRIKGIAIAQETGKSAKLFACRKLPKQFTSWRTYRDFLLSTHPREEHKAIFAARFTRHLDNEFVARQQCRQLMLNDYENNLPIDNSPDPRDALIQYYEETL